MPKISGRKAGDDKTYEFRLWDKSTNRMDRSITLDFVSVTSVITATLAKKQLDRWRWKTAQDLLVGAISHIDPDTLFDLDEDGYSPWDLLTDVDAVQEWLSENDITETELMRGYSERGKAAHSYFEGLAEAYLDGCLDAGRDEGSLRASERMKKRGLTPFESAINDWWATRNPHVLHSEKFLVSKRHDFAGTVDLIIEDEDGIRIIDLKTRKVGNGSYDSDHIQTGAYQIAYEEMTGLTVASRGVLLAQDDGTWEEPDSWVSPETFLHLRAVYAALEERR